MSIGQKGKGRETFSYLRASLAEEVSFTLVEFLITVLIMGVVMGGLFLTLNMGEFSNSISAKIEIQAEARRAMDWIAKDVRQTSSSQIANNSPTGSFIRFRLCLGHDGIDIIWSDDHIEYSYDDTLNQLTRTDYSTGRSWLFNNIISAPFDLSELISNNKLIVNITAEGQRADIPTITYTLNTKIKLRNG